MNYPQPALAGDRTPNPDRTASRARAARAGIPDHSPYWHARESITAESVKFNFPWPRHRIPHHQNRSDPVRVALTSQISIRPLQGSRQMSISWSASLQKSRRLIDKAALPQHIAERLAFP